MSSGCQVRCVMDEEAGGDLGPGVVEARAEEGKGRALIVWALALHLVIGTCGCVELRRTPSFS